MLRLAIRIAAAVASFGAFAFATPKPAQPKKPRNAQRRVRTNDRDWSSQKPLIFHGMPFGDKPDLRLLIKF